MIDFSRYVYKNKLLVTLKIRLDLATSNNDGKHHSY